MLNFQCKNWTNGIFLFNIWGYAQLYWTISRILNTRREIYEYPYPPYPCLPNFGIQPFIRTFPHLRSAELGAQHFVRWHPRFIRTSPHHPPLYPRTPVLLCDPLCHSLSSAALDNLPLLYRTYAYYFRISISIYSDCLIILANNWLVHFLIWNEFT